MCKRGIKSIHDDAIIILYWFLFLFVRDKYVHPVECTYFINDDLIYPY